MLGLAHRLQALVVVLALLGAMPQIVTRGCTTCGQDCPMHQHHPDKPGCHHGASAEVPASDGHSCLSAAGCGQVSVITSLAFSAVTDLVPMPSPVVRTELLAMGSSVPCSLDGVAPPHGPPEFPTV